MLSRERQAAPEEVASNIWCNRIPLPNSPLRYVNSYILMGARPLVIDTGFAAEECRRALEQSLQSLGLCVRDCDLYLTHFHSDHAGLADLFTAAGSRVYLHPADIPLTPGHGKTENIRECYDKAGMREEELLQLEQEHPGRYRAVRGEVCYTPVEEGELFTAAGRKFICLHVPGHTPGHTCLYCPEDGLLLAGDHLLFGISPNIVEWDCMPDSLGKYLNSLRRLQTLSLHLVLPGHRQGGEGQKRILELLQHHQLRLQEVMEILQGEPGLSAYETAARMRWDFCGGNWERFPLAQRWFAVGEAQAHLAHLLVQGKIRRALFQGVDRYTPAL